jgi:hypothetical protein
MKLIGIVVGTALLTAAPFQCNVLQAQWGYTLTRLMREYSIAADHITDTTAWALPILVYLLRLPTTASRPTAASHPTALRPIPIRWVRQLGAFSWGLSDGVASAQGAGKLAITEMPKSGLLWRKEIRRCGYF